MTTAGYPLIWRTSVVTHSIFYYLNRSLFLDDSTRLTLELLRMAYSFVMRTSFLNWHATPSKAKVQDSPLCWSRGQTSVLRACMMLIGPAWTPNSRHSWVTVRASRSRPVSIASQPMATCRRKETRGLPNRSLVICARLGNFSAVTAKSIPRRPSRKVRQRGSDQRQCLTPARIAQIPDFVTGAWAISRISLRRTAWAKLRLPSAVTTKLPGPPTISCSNASSRS